MRTLGNVLWHIPFCGFLSALLAFILGSLLTITVVAAPIGLGLIQYSKFLLLPFNYSMIKSSEVNTKENPYWKLYGTLLKILYVPFVGIPLLLITCIQIMGLVISIVGIPVAIPLAKSLGTLFQPVGKICAPRLVSDMLEQRKAEQYLNRFSSKE
ncbi:YccF domain-containing protein [Avibacterium avium]|uniref:YccF domain-containing protein n=1 Tax=Avibacterium avium TaxID=751 RepID=UPI003BF8B9B9